MTVATNIFDLIRQYCSGAKIIFNTIDLRFLRLQRAAELSGKRYDVEVAAQAEKMELDIILRSDCTLVVSDAEQELLAKLLPGSNVSVVPFPVDTYHGGKVFDERRDIVFVGSFRHDPNSDAVLFFTEEVWPLIADVLPEVRFVIAGPEMPERIKKLESNRILVRGFVDDLATVFGTAKISVAPLRYGAGIKGKVLTSLGYGVPCVATSVAAEGIGLTDGLNILIANTPVEIVDAVVRAFGSVELWTSLSEHGRTWVQNNYSREVVSSRLLEVIDKLQDVRV